MMKTLLAMGVLIALIGIFIGLYWLNKKTPVPAGCEDLEADCHACGIHSCLKNTANREEK